MLSAREFDPLPREGDAATIRSEPLQGAETGDRCGVLTPLVSNRGEGNEDCEHSGSPVGIDRPALWAITPVTPIGADPTMVVSPKAQLGSIPMWKVLEP